MPRNKKSPAQAVDAPPGMETEAPQTGPALAEPPRPASQPDQAGQADESGPEAGAAQSPAIPGDIAGVDSSAETAPPEPERASGDDLTQKSAGPPDSAPTLVLPTEITHDQASGCLHLLLTAARASHPDQGPFVVDAALLTRFDSSALAVLLECRRAVLGAGQPFIVRGMPARLAELARLYGVAELLEKS
jgi:phospholipid transport system transporter-binding protein